jgi:hypothetical protein
MARVLGQYVAPVRPDRPRLPQLPSNPFTTQEEQHRLAMALRADYASRPLTQAEAHHCGYNDDFEDTVRSLRRPAPYDLQSPLLALQKQISNVFRHGPQRAGGVFVNLSAAAESRATTVRTLTRDLAFKWNSCKAAATLVGILACPAGCLFEVAKFQSKRLNGLPSYDEVHDTPSTSLQTAFRDAKALARGEEGVSSVLVVSLADVHSFELERQRKEREKRERQKKKGRKKEKEKTYTSFAHTFVLGIGPEGVILWQAWGEHGYGLDQWIKDGETRVRTWQEVGDLVSDFESFVAYEVSHPLCSRFTCRATKTVEYGNGFDHRASGT